MICKCYLKENLLERNAMNFVNNIDSIRSSIFLYRENGRRVNGKSKIGLLSGRFMQGETIYVNVENPEDMSRVQDTLNEYGTIISS